MVVNVKGKMRGMRRGRPRLHEQPPGFVRRNLLVDAGAIAQLRTLYGTTSDSAAVRRAIDLALIVDEGQALGEWLAARGGPVDTYGPPPRLPVYLHPGGVAAEDQDQDDYPAR